jgi:hypothetical protein
MAVVTFAALVVKTNNPMAIQNVDRPIFVPMLCRWNRLRHFPDDKL